MWKEFTKRVARLPLIGVMVVSLPSPAQGPADGEGLVPLPVANKIRQLRMSDNDPAKSVEFQDQQEFFQPEFGRISLRKNTDIVYSAEIDDEKTRTKLGVSQGLYQDKHQQVRASVYGTKDFASLSGEEILAPDKRAMGIGGGASHSLRLTPSTEFQSAVVYEDDLDGKHHRLTGRVQVERKLTDRSLVSLGTSQVMDERGDLDHQIGARISFALGAKPKKEKKENSRRAHPWYEILVTKQKLDEGGLELGEDVELYSHMVENLLAFADQLEVAQEVDPKSLGELMERNNTANYPLGVALNSRHAMACRHDIVHAARSTALFYYELLKKRYPAHVRTRRLSYNEPVFDSIHRRGLSIHKKCVVQGGPATAPANKGLGTQ